MAERGHAMENKVEKLRKALGLNQEDFAKSIRVSRQTVSAIETGKYNPSLELAFIIADFFGKTIEEIFIYERKDKDWTSFAGRGGRNQGQTKQSVVWLFWRVYGCRDRGSLEIFLLERSRQQAEI